MILLLKLEGALFFIYGAKDAIETVFYLLVPGFK